MLVRILVKPAPNVVAFADLDQIRFHIRTDRQIMIDARAAAWSKAASHREIN